MSSYRDDSFIYLQPACVVDTRESDKDVTFALRVVHTIEDKKNDDLEKNEQVFYISTCESKDMFTNRVSKKSGNNKISKIYKYIHDDDEFKRIETAVQNIFNDSLWEAKDTYVSWIGQVPHLDEGKNWLIFTTTGIGMENSLHILNVENKQEIATYKLKAEELIVSAVLMPTNQLGDLFVFVQTFETITMQPYLLLFSIDPFYGSLQLVEKFDPFLGITPAEKNLQGTSIKTIWKFQYVARIGEYDIFVVVGLYEVVFFKISLKPVTQGNHFKNKKKNPLCHVLGVIKNTDLDMKESVKSSLNFTTFEIMHFQTNIFDLSLKITCATRGFSDFDGIFEVTLSHDQIHGLRRLEKKKLELLTEDQDYFSHSLINNYFHFFGFKTLNSGKKVIPFKLISQKHEEYSKKESSRNHHNSYEMRRSIPDVKSFHHQDHFFFYFKGLLYFQDLQDINYRAALKTKQMRFCINLPT